MNDAGGQGKKCHRLITIAAYKKCVNLKIIQLKIRIYIKTYKLVLLSEHMPEKPTQSPLDELSSRSRIDQEDRADVLLARIISSSEAGQLLNFQDELRGLLPEDFRELKEDLGDLLSAKQLQLDTISRSGDAVRAELMKQQINALNHAFSQISVVITDRQRPSDNQAEQAVTMVCPSCGAPNREAASFCGKCGTSLISNTELLVRVGENPLMMKNMPSGQLSIMMLEASNQLDALREEKSDPKTVSITNIREKLLAELKSRCPKCGKPIVEGASFCGKCGESLQDKKLCQRCGKSNRLEANYCGKCGAQYASEKPR